MNNLRYSAATVESIAKVAHETNRAYCQTIGDHSQPSWDDAPDWQKNSIRNGVYSIIENPDITPQQNHENWMRHKEQEGWVYGPVKDPVLKYHPCMVPYGQLPAEQKKKDALFQAVVRTMLF